MTNKKMIKTRPCKPGDILAFKGASCGATGTIRVTEPTSHPESGITDDRSIRLQLIISIPTKHYQCIKPVFQDRRKKVLGDELCHSWGISHLATQSTAWIYETSDTVKGALDSLLLKMNESLDTLQSLYDVHMASVTAQQRAREEAYAAWPVVADEEEDEEA